ncbi:unnamed protein product [Rotaria sp. Silwood2]|nr:unnamed protein product [Rotaria sp. Silwood2]
MEHLKTSSNQSLNHEYTLCVFGEGAVGKTSLTTQFVEGVFTSKYHTTIEDVFKKTIEVDGKRFILEIVDTAGTENFTAMRDLNIQHSQGFAIVYSITSQATFDHLHYIYNQIMNIKKEQPAMVLVGNKIDLSGMKRAVHREKGQALADEWKCSFYETSAKDSINVHEIFIDLIRQIDRRTSCTRKTSIFEDIPLLTNSLIENIFCCLIVPRKKKAKEIMK